MLTCYHIPIYHNRAVPCRVARLFQPCWLSTAQHGFASVYTSNFNRTVPCQTIPCRAGTEKLCRVNGVLVPTPQQLPDQSQLSISDLLPEALNPSSSHSTRKRRLVPGCTALIAPPADVLVRDWAQGKPLTSQSHLLLLLRFWLRQV